MQRTDVALTAAMMHDVNAFCSVQSFVANPVISIPDLHVLLCAADYALSNELAELHHANSLQADDPNNADKMGASRQSIIAEVESSLAAQYAAMSSEELHQWHATLQQSLSEASDAHHKAKDYLKQVNLRLVRLA